MKTFVAAMLACGLLVAACGGNSKEAQSKAFCDAYAKGMQSAKEAGSDPSQMKKAIETYKAAFANLEKAAPSEIKGDVTEQRKFLEIVATMYEKNNFQPSPDDMKKLQENAQAFQKMQQSQQKITQYVTKNCPDLAKQFSGGGQNPPTTKK